MAEPQRFRKRPVEIEAMQWDRSDQAANALWEWTNHVVATREDGSPAITSAQFMVLQDWANSDAEETLGESEVLDRVAAGYSAVIYDRLHGTWVNVATGDWIIKGVQGEFYPCRPDVFAETYEDAQRETGVDLIAAERRRQVEVKGYTPEHDAEHGARELAEAGAAYAIQTSPRAAATPRAAVEVALGWWPWSRASFKPDRYLKPNLVKAGALIAAAIDRVLADEQAVRDAK